MEENDPPESPSSALALVCGWICLAAYLWPVLHALGGTYDGAMTWCLSFLLLVPAIPMGSIAAFLALTKDPVRNVGIAIFRLSARIRRLCVRSRF